MKTIGRIGCAVSFFEHEGLARRSQEFELTRIIFTALQIREEDNTDNNDNICMTEVMSEKKSCPSCPKLSSNFVQFRWIEDNTDNNDNICMTEVMCEKKKVVHVVLSCLKILYSLDE